MAAATSPDATILSELAKACDGQARPATEDDDVAGTPARLVAVPASTEQTAEVLRVAAQHDLRVVARGARTRLDWGAPPVAVDVVLDTTGLRGVVEHAAGDLVTVVRAGTPLRDLQATLGEAGQRLALDSPLDGSTVGGTVATNASGPLRLLYGTVRDLLIGVTVVRADGVVAHAGGKVVKNVAGYDLGKLLTGSYGTLGVVTECAFRLHPLPAARHAVQVAVPDAPAAGRAVAAVLGSQVVPSAVEVDWAGRGGGTVAVLLEGVAEGVAARATATAELLGTEAGEGALPGWWGRYPFGPGDTGIKLTAEIAGLGRLLDTVTQAADRGGVTVTVRGSAAGVLYAGVPAGTDPGAVARLVSALRAGAPAYGGSVVVLTAPPPVRAVVDLWGPVPAIGLMRRVKARLDPDHRLSPGRFAGGI